MADECIKKILVKPEGLFELCQRENWILAKAKTKAQISFAVTAKLIERLCFRYSDSTTPCVAAQAGLCWTWSEILKTDFSASRLIY